MSRADEIIDSAKKTIKKNPNAFVLVLGLLAPTIVVVGFIIFGNNLAGNRGLSERNYSALGYFSITFLVLGLFSGSFLTGSTAISYFLRLIWIVCGAVGLYTSLRGTFLNSNASISSCVSYIRENDDDTQEILNAKCEKVSCNNCTVNTEWEDPEPTTSP
tara:strand:- start:16 stop:495 length:480 start_codon:yes stop_codon:yes gene_type:complete